MAPFSDKELEQIKLELVGWAKDNNKTVKEMALGWRQAVEREVKRRQKQAKERGHNEVSQP